MSVDHETGYVVDVCTSCDAAEVHANDVCQDCQEMVNRMERDELAAERESHYAHYAHGESDEVSRRVYRLMIWDARVANWNEARKRNYVSELQWVHGGTMGGVARGVDKDNYV